MFLSTATVPVLPAPTFTISASRPLGKTAYPYTGRVQFTGSGSLRPSIQSRLFQSGRLIAQPQPFQGRRPITHATQSAAVICAAALNARCGMAQTQTATQKTSTITVAPGKEKLPRLDDGGSGFRGIGYHPYYRGGDGGGGDGGGGGFFGGGFPWHGFWFFMFLNFLLHLKKRSKKHRKTTILGLID